MIYTVSQINSYIKSLFAHDYCLRSITVKGEVSNCKYHSGGHIYFTLKDSGGTLSAIMFASRRNGLSFVLKDGMQVEVSGSIEVYEKGGTYQIYASSIKQAGLGELYERFIEMRDRLEEMGMFAPEYKKPIPTHAGVIGIATASTGAAVHDIINVTTRRNPYVQLVFCPTKVQGEGAALSIVSSIKKLDAYGCDVLIVGRGGGSLEDLWAFNEEIVARAIFDAKTPVISAVGHETDFTIADYVADLRAPTPSAAAELATFDMMDFEAELVRKKESLTDAMLVNLNALKQHSESAGWKLSRLAPQAMLNAYRVQSEDARTRLTQTMRDRLIALRHALEIDCEKLKGLSPLEKIASGYAWVSDDNGKHIKSCAEVNAGDSIKLRFSDGALSATVTGKTSQ